VIKDVRRHMHREKHQESAPGPGDFFVSAECYEWMLFACALAIFFPLALFMQDWPSTTRFHVVALFIWLGVGVMYNIAVAWRLGRSSGVMWFTGYLLELIFSVENVFIFHIVEKAFRSPQHVTQKALFIVICCQIVFEMIFFMGLAVRVRSLQALPYVLGVWLLYLGYNAAGDDGHEDFNVKESKILRMSQHIFGNRFVFTYGPTGNIFVVKHGKLCVSLVFPLVLSMLAVDFFLEVDVVLTKIEELPNQYIAFTSSAVAAFAVPELFFVARDLFQRYGLLKYGVSFVLCFFGIQMLFHRFFVLPDLAGCAIIIIVMVACMLASPPLSSKFIDGEVVDDEQGWHPKLSTREPDSEPPTKWG